MPYIHMVSSRAARPVTHFCVCRVRSVPVDALRMRFVFLAEARVHTHTYTHTKDTKHDALMKRVDFLEALLKKVHKVDQAQSEQVCV